jgi:indole-3-glycerol phosphate synthase
VAVIAELKRRSPSRGEINVRLSPAAQAAAYQGGGAAAISVLTEEHHFGGSAEDFVVVRSTAAIPVLKKDFHVDPIQLLEARALGASAVLLIARAVEPALLSILVHEAAELGVEPFVEVRSEVELERVLATGARVVGVNSRDLESLSVDPAVTERLVPQIPRSRVAVAESGLATRSDVERVAQSGADAVLVGSALSAASDPASAVRGLTGVRRGLRAP